MTPRRAKFAPHLAVMVALVALVVTSLGGCGGDGGTDVDLATQSIINTDELPKAAITDEDREQFKPGSVEVSFLDYWESLQFQDLPTTAAFYAPGLRRAIGEERLIEALRSQAPAYRSRRPGIVRATSDRGLTSVRYLFQDPSGELVPHTITWQRRPGGNWTIVFNSYLADSLYAIARNQAQARIDPASQQPPPAAEQAGVDAAQRQDAFLERLLAEPGA